jgi:fused signal recognition particle receptor
MDLVVIIAVLALAVVAVSAVVIVSSRRRGDESLGVGDVPAETRRGEAGRGAGTGTAVAPAPTEAEAPTVEAPPGPPPTFRERLGKARGTLSGYLTSIRSRKVDAQTWDDLEEALIRADVGVAATQRILDDLRGVAKAESISDPDALIDRLKAELKSVLAEGDRSLAFRGEAGSPAEYPGSTPRGRWAASAAAPAGRPEPELHPEARQSGRPSGRPSPRWRSGCLRGWRPAAPRRAPPCA